MAKKNQKTDFRKMNKLDLSFERKELTEGGYMSKLSSLTRFFQSGRKNLRFIFANRGIVSALVYELIKINMAIEKYEQRRPGSMGQKKERRYAAIQGELSRICARLCNLGDELVDWDKTFEENRIRSMKVELDDSKPTLKKAEDKEEK